MPSINPSRRQAFTLIEISLVLVVIGLLVGGTIVGQTMVHAAQIRNTLSAFEEYRVAAEVFSAQYDGLPGDLSDPAGFGLASTSAGTSMKGATGTYANNNGFVESCATIPTNYAGYGVCGEAALFWKHLAQAELIGGNYTVTDYDACAALSGSLILTTDHLPQVPLHNAFIHVSSYSAKNYFVLGHDKVNDATYCSTISKPVVTPAELYDMDVKIDDGVATTGKIISLAEARLPESAGGGSSSPDTAGGGNDCYDTDTNEYAISTDELANQVACQFRVEAGF